MSSELRQCTWYPRIFSLCFSIGIVITALSTPVFAQMYNNITLYNDAEPLGQTLHVWAYTYAPSGNQIVHRYRATAEARLPGGSYAQQSDTGSGGSAAIADVYITVPEDDIVNDMEGEIEISTLHQAFCPQVASGTVAFFTARKQLPFQVRVVQLTAENTMGYQEIGNVRFCNNVQACTNTGVPMCGAGTSSVQTSINRPCCPFWKSFYFALIWYSPFSISCSYGAAVCWAGPGYCTPYP